MKSLDWGLAAGNFGTSTGSTAEWLKVTLNLLFFCNWVASASGIYMVVPQCLSFTLFALVFASFVSLSQHLVFVHNKGRVNYNSNLNFWGEGGEETLRVKFERRLIEISG